jgi:fibronectin-binding autotransporter adhesin
MKSKPLLLISRLMYVATLVAVSSPAFAGSLTWDGNGSTAPNPNGGAGTWNTNSTVSWWNGSANVVWPAAGGTDDDAVFANTAATVTVATVTANDLTFSTTGYTLSSGTLTLNGLTPTVNTASDVTATISSVIAGTAGMKKDGLGTLTLSGGNTYTGATTVNTGTLRIGNGTGVGSIASTSAVSVASGATIEWFHSSSNYAVGNSIIGSGQLKLQGTNATNAQQQGLYQLTGNNSAFTGELVLNRALSWNNTTAARFGSGTIRIQDRATLAVNGGVTANNTIIIENGAGWWHNGNLVLGALRMEGTNTFTGNLQLNHSTGVTLGDNTGANSTLGSNGSANNTFSGVISGAGELSMSRYTSYNGGSVQTANIDLSGTASNTYTGKTVVDGQGAVANLRLMKTGGAVAIPGGNVVQFGSATGGQANLRMGDTTATGSSRSQWDNQFGTTNGGVLLNFINGSGQWGRFDLQGTQQSVAGLNAGTLTTLGGGVIQNQNLQGFDPGQDATLSLIGTGNYVYNGYLRNADNGSNVRKLNLVKAGSGTQTLVGGAISYSGTTTVNGGRLVIHNTGTSFGSLGMSIATGAVMEFNSSSTVQLYNNGQTLTGTGILEKTGPGSLLFGGNGRVVNISLGSGALIDVKEGILRNEYLNGTWTANLADMTIGSTAKVDVWDSDIRVDSLNGTGNVNEGIGANKTLTVGVDNGSGVFDGTMTNTNGKLNFVKTGTGTQTLSGTNTFTGTTSITGGTLLLTNSFALGSSILDWNNYGGSLNLGPLTSLTLGGLQGAQNFPMSNASATPIALTVGNGNVSSTTSGALLGGTTLTKTGSGSFIMGGTSPNTYTGLTTLNQGVIGLSKQGAFAIPGDFTASNITSPDVYTTENNQFAPGSVMRFTGSSGDHVRFELLGTTQTLAGIDNTDTSGRGVIQHREQAAPAAVSAISNLILNVSGSGPYSYDGYLRSHNGGTMTLTKSGTGTQILSGTNINYSGATTVNGGTLVLRDTLSFGSAINNNATVEFNAVSSSRTGGSVSGSGIYNKTGAGIMRFNGGQAITASGTINVQQGTLQNDNNTVNWSGNTADVNISSGAILDLYADAVYVDGLSGTGFVQNNYGNTSNQSGDSVFIEKLVVGMANGTSTFGGVIRNNAGSNVPASATSGGGIQLEKQGSGTLTLTGNNTYTGRTDILGGTLALGSGGNALPISAVVNLANTAGAQLVLNHDETFSSLTGGGSTGGNVNLQGNTLTLTTTASSTFAGSISGTGGLTKTGSGTLTLSGDSTHSGATSINNGTLNLTGSLANSEITIPDGSLISGEGSADSIVIGDNFGADLIADPSTTDVLHANTLSLNGETFVRLNGTIPASEEEGGKVEIKILSFNTKGPGDGWDPGMFYLVGGDGNYREPVFKVNANDVTLEVGGKMTLEWYPAAYGEETPYTWDMGGEWTSYFEGGHFYAGDDVKFGELPFNAIGAFDHQTIDIPVKVLPGKVLVESTHDYTFIGAGIGGGGGLTKMSTGTLDFSDLTNTYLGATLIQGGTVIIGSDASLGAAPAAPTPGHLTLNGGTLEWNGFFDLNANRGIAIGSNGGNLDISAAGTDIVEFASPVTGSGLLTLHQANDGNAKISGDMSAFTGEFKNEGGNLHISPSSADWADTTIIQDTTGGWVKFDGGGTATVKSISSTHDVLVNNGTRLDVGSGGGSMATNNVFWKSDAGELGELTSSTGILTLTNGSATGNVETLDHEIQLRLVDFEEATPLAFVKNGVNQLAINQANTFSGGATINGGRIQADHLLAFGSGQVTVNTGGQAFLSTAGTYANDFTIAGNGITETTGTLGGALRFNSNVVVAGNLTVNAAGASMITPTGAVGTLTGALLGSGNLGINSSTGNNGTLNLNGNSSGYSGTVTLSQGRLNLNSPSIGGSLAVADNATLGGEATVAGTVTLGSTVGSTLAIDALSPAALTSTGAMTVNGTVNVSLSGVVPAGTPIKIVGFGSKAGSWNTTNFALSGFATLRSGTAFNETATAIELTIPTFDLAWNNTAGNSTWNTNVDANFKNSAQNTEKFLWGDQVTFGDLPATAQNITVSGSVQPATMTVNSQYAYDFTGGSIDGGGSLVKLGAGMLTLNQANTFSGGTTVSGGTLTLTLGGEAGTIRGAVTVNAYGTLLLQNDNVLGSATGSKVNVINLNDGTVTHAGSGDNGWGVTYNLTGGTLQSTGAGQFAFGGNTAVTTLASATTATIAGKVQLREDNENNNVNFTVADGAAAKDLVVTAAISEKESLVGGITKQSAGTMELSGANTYTGTTTVNGGTILADNTTGSATGTGAVVVNDTGTFGGTGSVTGSITVNSGGKLAPGASIESLATGSLTLAAGSTYAIEYNSTGTPAADVTQVTGDVTLTGSLTLADLAATPTAILPGTKLTLLTYTGSLIGTFDGLSDGGMVTSGDQTFTIRYADGNAVTLEATTFVVSNPFGSWATNAGLDGTPGKENGLMDDPDKDGRSNLLEFYLDGNPLANDPSKQPVTTLNATYLTLTFKRRDDAEADVINQVIAYGTNLATWSEAVIGATSSTSNGVIVTIVENDTAPDDITVQIPRTLAAGGKLFARLKVSE